MEPAGVDASRRPLPKRKPNCTPKK